MVKINTGGKWTVLSTECYLTQVCSKCFYWRYCKTTKPKNKDVDPALKQVVAELLVTLGEPEKEFLDKAKEIIYSHNRKRTKNNKH